MIASTILMVLTIALIFVLNTPTAPVDIMPLMVLWASLGIMSEIRRANPKPKKTTVKVEELPADK